MTISTLRFVAITLLLTGTIGSIAAEQGDKEARILSDRWYVSIGGAGDSFDTTAAFGIGGIVGSVIRAEDQLNLESNQANLRFNGIYAFNPKHQIDFTLTDSSRDGLTTIDEEIVIGDPPDGITFQVGADIATQFDSQSLKVFYKYSFVNNGKTQAGIGAGLSLFDYVFEFEGMALVDDGSGDPPVQEFARASEDILAPIPSFLIFIHHAFNPRFIFRITAGFFDIDIGDFSGRLIETRATLEYFVTKRISLGGGVEGSDIEFRDSGDDPWNVAVNTSSVIYYVGLAF